MTSKKLDLKLTEFLEKLKNVLVYKKWFLVITTKILK